METETIKPVDIKEDAKEEVKEEKPVEKSAYEIPKAIKDAHKEFDKKIDSDDDSAIEDIADADDIKPVKAEKKVVDEKDSDKKDEQQEEISEIDEVLADRIEKSGLTEKQVEKFGTIEALENALDIIEARQSKEIVAEGQKKSEVDEKVEDVKPYNCGLDPDAYDEGLIKAVNSLGQTFTDKIKALENEKAELLQVVNQQKTEKDTEWIDSKIIGLGEDFKDVLGDGEFEDIEPGSIHFENRGKITARMNAIVKSCQSLGKPAPSRNKLFKQAVEYLWKDKMNKSKDDAVTKEKLAARAGQTIGRGSRRSSTTTAIEKAIQAQKDFDAKIDA